ncbi:UDP-glycosyltransferase 88B1-like [Musa acuminata AAA Group]|uniref:UDP-glycosyltransferase 88B1-like n=1 Tax=Musa acuminata AAA Group TaxID=214697 RepID=UPI0031DE34C4
MKQTVVLYAVPAMGHLVPMVELAKLFVLHDFSVAVVLMHTPVKHPSVDPFVARVSSAYPSISFHQLPPAASLPDTPVPRFLDLVLPNNPQLLYFLEARSRTSDVRAVVLDFFCTGALAVTANLRLPSYFFFASCAAVLAAFLYLPTLYATADIDLKALGDSPLHFPGLPPVPASDMPRNMIDRDEDYFKRMIRVLESLPNADGILVNSFESLEAEAVRVLRDGACIPGRRMPPVYCIGPLIADGSRDVGGEKMEKAECASWLDEQPRGSVVFLCFGSMGMFSVEQLKEIAAGLERSGQRFLWVVRAPRSESQGPQGWGLQSEPDLEALFPEGFLERTKQRGFLAKSWAPQVEVLNHEAVGGFVTHCGWNSVLEAITAGVPMIGWPLYAEQGINRVLLVEQMRVAVVMEGCAKELVAAEEVEARIRWLMESEGGRDLRARAVATKQRAAEAIREAGSSHQAWLDVVKTLRNASTSPLRTTGLTSEDHLKVPCD